MRTPGRSTVARRASMAASASGATRSLFDSTTRSAQASWSSNTSSIGSSWSSDGSAARCAATAPSSMLMRPSDSANASTTVTTPSTVARVRTAGHAKAFSRGCGNASPEVSMTMASSGCSRDNSLSMVGMKSSATVQQMQPLVSSTISPGAQALAAHSSTRPPSKPASPNSLTMTAMRRPPASLSNARSSVVLPAPRKPVSTVTGTRFMATHSPAGIDL